MTSRHFILATAGHVDHGKSSLVRALTGIDPDRLPEEKKRGITIDLGFAHLELKAHTADNQKLILNCGVVDVPGHEDFVKNMVAGVGAIDLALFVVAADDGWMPQTEEHLQILTYLGVNSAVVALTKIDLMPEKSALIAEIREKLSGSPFSNAPIVPVSVVTGRGISELKSALAQSLSTAPCPRDVGKPRLPIDRLFILRGVGAVVTGTLMGGCLQRGQMVSIQPGNKSARIRSVQSHNCDLETSQPARRTALNLTDIDVAANLHRGDVVTLPAPGGASLTVDVRVEKTGRLAGKKTLAARALKDGARIRVHHGSGNFAARIFLLDKKQVGAGEQSIAQLRLESPLFAFLGDRFILRDWPEQATLAGGVILDPDAVANAFRSGAQKNLLQRRAENVGDATLCLETALDRDRALFQNRLLLKSSFNVAEIDGAVEVLTRSGRAIVAGDFLVQADFWRTLLDRAAAIIDQAHQQHPEQAGISLTELRAALEKEVGELQFFDPLVAGLCGGGFLRMGNVIKRANHRAALPPQWQAAGKRIRAALAARPFDPPSRKELAPDPASQQALRYLLQNGEAMEIGTESILSQENFLKATTAIKIFLRARGRATAGELRQMLGTNRRIVIPLLERLDRDGVTRRDGDHRSLRE